MENITIVNFSNKLWEVKTKRLNTSKKLAKLRLENENLAKKLEENSVSKEINKSVKN